MTGYRLVALAGLALLVGSSAHGMNAPAALQSNELITEVAVGCGPGRTRVNGVCVARTTVRQTRRAVRRCVRWQGGACVSYN